MSVGAAVGRSGGLRLRLMRRRRRRRLEPWWAPNSLRFARRSRFGYRGRHSIGSNPRGRRSMISRQGGADRTRRWRSRAPWRAVPSIFIAAPGRQIHAVGTSTRGPHVHTSTEDGAESHHGLVMEVGLGPPGRCVVGRAPFELRLACVEQSKTKWPPSPFGDTRPGRCWHSDTADLSAAASHVSGGNTNTLCTVLQT